MGQIYLVNGGSYSRGFTQYWTQWDFANTAKLYDVTGYEISFDYTTRGKWSSITMKWTLGSDNGGVWYQGTFSVSGGGTTSASASVDISEKPNNIRLRIDGDPNTNGSSITNLKIIARYKDHSTDITLTNPKDEAELSYGAKKQLSWKLNHNDTFISQTLYYKKTTVSNWVAISIAEDLTSGGDYSYTFASKFLSLGEWEWYVEAKCKYSEKTSPKRTFTVGLYPPSVTDLSPDETTVERMKKVKFSWNITSKVDMVSQTLYWKKSTATSYNKVTVNRDVKSYTFDAGTFPIGTIQWYLEVVNIDEAVKSGTAVFTSGYPITIKQSTPDNGANLQRSTANKFKWSITCSIGLSSVKLYWKLTTSSSWNVINLPIDDNEYEIPANTFPVGSIQWYIYALNTDGVSNTSATRTFTCGKPVSVTLTSPVGLTIPKSLQNTFEWAITSDIDVNLTELYWKMAGDSSYRKIILEAGATTYTFNAGTFNLGTVYWYVKTGNIDGLSATSEVSAVTCGSTPTCIVTYPKEVNIRNDVLQIFTWAYEDLLGVPQASFEIGYRKKNSESYTTITVSADRQYYEFAANTFDTGEYIVRVRVTNTDGITSAYSYSEYFSVGQSTDPIITDVSNSSIPEISWTSSDQDTYEIEIFEGNTRIYESGAQIGRNVTSFRPNLMLKDGSYSVRIRTMNIYGFFSNWIAQSFILNTTKPDTYTCYAYANDKYGVDVRRSLELDESDAQSGMSESSSGETVPEHAYVIRSEFGKNNWKILGKLDVNNEMVIFHDYTPTPGVKYEYAIRSLLTDGGYADSNAVAITIRHDGLVLYDFKDKTCVKLDLSEDQKLPVSQSASKEYSYSHMIGREWPVRESADWKNHTLNISCYVTIEQYRILYDMMMSEHPCWCKRADFSYACAIDAIPISRTFLNKGYNIDLTVSQVDAEEVKLLE